MSNMEEVTQVINVSITCPFCNAENDYQVLVGDSTYIVCMRCSNELTVITKLKVEVIAEVI